MYLILSQIPVDIVVFTDTCAGIQCKFGAVCEGGRCVCPQQCPSLADPVCGSDGQTYMNQCELRRQACAVTTDIAILHAGECDDEMYGQESGSGGRCTATVKEGVTWGGRGWAGAEMGVLERKWVYWSGRWVYVQERGMGVY